MNKKDQLLLEAITLFDQKAKELIQVLAKENNLDLTKKDPFSELISRKNNRWKGELSNNWIYQFHGDACKFENRISKQLVDVKINLSGNYGAISDFYLFQFIQTTDSLTYLKKTFQSIQEISTILIQLYENDLLINVGFIEFQRFALKFQG